MNRFQSGEVHRQKKWRGQTLKGERLLKEELLLNLCHYGHTPTLCSTSRAQVQNRISTCRHAKVVGSFIVPCKYCCLGCTEIFPNCIKAEHEALCDFQPYSCPYAGFECTVVGDAGSLVIHLRDDHGVDTRSDYRFHHEYMCFDAREVESGTWVLPVFHCFGRYFCLHFEAFQLESVPVFMGFIRFMGSEVEAQKYGYSLEVRGGGRKMAWEGIPRSICDSKIEVMDSLDGLILQRSVALMFSGGNRLDLKLRVAGEIWEQEQQNVGFFPTESELHGSSRSSLKQVVPFTPPSTSCFRRLNVPCFN